MTLAVLVPSTGCVLGLGLVLSALCSSGQLDQHVHVSQTLDKLLANLQDSSGQGRMLQEVQQPQPHPSSLSTIFPVKSQAPNSPKRGALVLYEEVWRSREVCQSGAGHV